MYGVFGENTGRETTGRKALLPAMLAAVFFCLWTVSALAWHVPDVEITAPSDGDSLSGVVSVSADYSVSPGNVHSVQLLVDGDVVFSVAVHQHSGAYTFNWNSATVDDGPHVLAVRAYTAAPPSDHFYEVFINITTSNIACSDDLDCDDADDLTLDVCQNPGTPSAVCVNTPIACNDDADCDDSDDLTIDTCTNPGTTAAACVNTAIACNDNSDCNDSDPGTIDECVDGGTISATCLNTPVACVADMDCDDADPLTLDSCDNPGTAGAVCVNTPIACNDDADCDDSDELTIDTCTNPGTTAAVCVNTAIACNNDADCDDSDPGTIDECENGGTVSAVCVNAPVACSADADCNDPDPLTLDTCEAPGTAEAVCLNIPFACINDSDCDDSNELTVDTCDNPGTAGAVCVNIPIACNNDTDCDDSDELTIDTCTNPGTTAAACVNTPIACNIDTDCDDGDDATEDVCRNAGTAAATCTNNPVLCAANEDCDDANLLTLDTCVNGGTASAECVYTDIECLTNTNCDDGNHLTKDICINGGTEAAECIHIDIECVTGADCDDGDAYTLDTCRIGVEPEPTCVHQIIACLSDEDCDDGNALTEDSCENAGTAAAACSNETICEPACASDADCDDGDTATTDTCESPGTCDAACSHDAVCEPECLSDADCDDADENTTDTCESPGTCDAVCAHEPVEEPVEPEEPEDQDTTPPAIGDATYDDGQILIAIEDEPGGSGLDESSIVVLVDGDAATGDYDAASRLYRIVTGLIPGAHVLTVTAADLAGNTAQEIISLEVAAGAVQVRILEVPGAPVGPDGGAPPQSSWGDFLPAPDEPDWSSDGFDKLIKKWKSNWPQWPPQWPQQWPDTGEQAPPVWAGVQPPCDEVSGEISDDQPAAPEGYSTDGDIVAEVLAVDSEVDEDSIAVEVNGKRVGHSFDKQTGRVKAKSGKLPKGNHTVEVTAADTTGTEGMALMSFGTGATVTSIQLENLSTGGGSIGLGDQFRITVELDQADLTDAWAVLMNPDNPSADEGEHYIGWPYPLTSTGPGSFTYTFDGYFYTSFDFGELDATRIVAAVPMDDPPTSYMYSNDLTVENPPVRPQFENLQFDNVTNPGPRAISIGDDYFVSANGTPGVQGGMYLVLNLDTLTGGVGTPADALVQGGNMEESPDYGSGYYEIQGGSANLATLEDAQSQTSRVLLSMVCAPAAGGACSYGPLLYVDNEPNMYSVTLENLSAPGEPFTSTGQQFRLSVQAPGLDPVHEPHLMGMVLNADRVPDFFPTTEDSPNLTDPFLQLTYESGDTYAVTGTLDTFTDGDGFDAESVVGVVTIASYFDIAGISDPISVEQAPEVEIYRINIRNITYPDRMSIDIGEEFEITADAEPGLDLVCFPNNMRFGGSGDPNPAIIPMTEYSDGNYSCAGTVTSRLDLNGLAADLIMGKVMPAGGDVSTAGMSEDFLTFRNDIIEVHISNTTRPGAGDIAPGEHFLITATAAAGHSEINGGLIDIPVFTSPLPGGPFVQITDPLTEDPPGSGQYSVEAMFLAPPEGVDHVRGFAGNPASDDTLTLTLSTEKLDVLAAAPGPPTTITRVAGQDVIDDEVTANEFAPIVEGAAPADSTVNIYELIPGGSIGDMVPLGSGLMSATALPPGTIMSDDFDDPALVETNWELRTDDGGSIELTNDILTMEAAQGEGPWIWKRKEFTPSNDFFTEIAVMFNSPGMGTASDNVSFSMGFEAKEGWADGGLVTTWKSDGTVWIHDLTNSIPETSVNYGVPVPDTWYTMMASYNATDQTITVSINNIPVITSDPGFDFIDLPLYNRFSLSNNSSQNSIKIALNDFTSDIPLVGYDISAPALSLNGQAYDTMGADIGILIDTCSGEPRLLPANAFTCINGDKDILAYLITVKNLVNMDTGEVIAEQAPLTFYSAGRPENPGSDQTAVAEEFLEYLIGGGAFSDYTIDAYGTAFTAQGYGNDYIPNDPVSAQMLMCNEEEQPGYLRWDSDNQQYLTSYTPLSYQGTDFDAFEVFGFGTETDPEEPVMVNADDTPVPWADGTQDVAVVLVSVIEEPGDPPMNFTVYGQPEIIFDEGNPDEQIASIDNIFTANGPGADYTWNQADLAAEGISVAPSTTCGGYGRTLIAQTTAAAGDTYATQTIPFAAPGDHLIYAQSLDTATGDLLGQSSIVTYHLEGGAQDTTPPDITFTSHTGGDMIAEAQPTISATVTDTDSGVDWNSLTCEPAGLCEVNHTGGDNVDITFTGHLAQGGNTITLTAADLAAPANTAAQDLYLIVDSLGPEISNIAETYDPFSPNGDGAKDITTITADISDPHPGPWEIWVQDDSGTIREYEGTGAQAIAEWDGVDANSILQPDGEYLYIIMALDALDNYREATGSVTLDTTPPQLAIIAPADGEWLSPAPYAVRVNALDENGIETVTIQLDSGAAQPASHIGGGIYELPLDFTGLGNSDHIITATALDNAANTTTAAVNIHVHRNTIDIDNITFENLTRPGATDLAVGDSFRVEIEVSKPQGVPLMRLINFDRWPAETGPGVDIAYQITSVNEHGKFTTVEGVLLSCLDGDGQTVPRIAAVGSTDGYTTATLSGTLDILSCAPAPPAPPVIIKPQSGAEIRNATPTVRGTAEPGVTVYIYLGDPDDTDPDTLIATATANDRNGKFSADTMDLGIAGPKTIYAIAEKQLPGMTLQSDPSESVTFTLKDTEKPVITDQTAYPDPFSPGDNPGGKDTTTISAVAWDESLGYWRIRIFTIDAAGEPDQRLLTHEEDFINPDPVEGNPFSFEWDGYRVRNNGTRILQIDGVYYYELRAWDTNNKKSEIVTGTIVIDQTVPNVTIIDPADGALLGGIQYQVSLQATDDLEIDTIEIHIDGNLYTTAWSPDANDQYIAILALRTLDDGPHTLSAVAIDTAGNRSAEHTISITVDNKIPNPPENLTAIDNADGTVTLLWTPPTTNQDGSPLTDLAGYNIYIATETGRCEPVYPVDPGQPIVCEPGAAPDTWTINGPALQHNLISYDQNPLGGNGPLWLDAQAAAAGAPPAQALQPLPLVDSTMVQADSSVFSYQIRISFTAQSGLPVANYYTTIYSQLNQNELDTWLAVRADNGLIEAEYSYNSTVICTAGANGFSPHSTLYTIPEVVNIQQNTSLVTINEFSIPDTDEPFYFTVISQDEAGNTSRQNILVLFDE